MHGRGRVETMDQLVDEALALRAILDGRERPFSTGSTILTPGIRLQLRSLDLDEPAHVLGVRRRSDAIIGARRAPQSLVPGEIGFASRRGLARGGGPRHPPYSIVRVARLLAPPRKSRCRYSPLFERCPRPHGRIGGSRDDASAAAVAALRSATPCGPPAAAGAAPLVGRACGGISNPPAARCGPG